MTEAFRLSPQQKRLWLLQQNQTARLDISIDGNLDADALKRAVDQIVARHEILRTKFQRQQGIRTAVQLITEVSQCSYSLSRIATDRHLLELTFSSLCCDASTLRCFYDELCRTYEALVAGTKFNVETMQYADFAAWQNELLESEVANAGREFWQQRRRPQPSTDKSFEPCRFVAGNLPLENFVTDRSAFLETCWQTLLWRLTRQPEIIIGRISHGRNYDELKEAFGIIAKCVPVPVQLGHDPSFADQLRETARDIKESERWLEFYEWDDDEYLPECFEYQQRGSTYRAGDVLFRIHDQFVCFDRFNLKLVGVENDTGLCAEIHYAARVVTDDAVRCIADQFQELVASAFHNPKERLSELRLLSSSERRRLVVDVNQTARSYPPLDLVHTLFEQQVECMPNGIAVVCAGERLSYSELNTRANQLAHYLQELGVGPEVPVILNVERSPETLIGILAILKAGGAYVPLEGIQPAQRLASILEETKAPVIVTQRALREQFHSRSERVICLDTEWALLAQKGIENLNVDVRPDNLAYVIYTSGSTGKPKGVSVEHEQLANYLHAICDELGTHESYATVSTFAADLGNTMIYPALCTGAALHLITKHQATDAAALSDHFTRHRIDCLKIVPSHLETLLAHDQSGALIPRKLLVLGGEAATPGLIETVQDRAPECVVYNHYGPTESTVGVLTCRVAASTRVQKPLPLGKPLANNTVYVLDRRLNPVSVGETGEIYLGGAQISRGYINEPGVTAERFVPNPFSAQGGARLYRTGDLGRFLPDGKVEFGGRADNQIKLHGYRIELGEIRYALNRHPEISDSVAVITKDSVIAAYYIAARDVEAGELRSFLSDYLGAQAVPNYFSRLAKFPLTANGKVDLQALARLRPAEGAARSIVLPATPMEELLAGLWINLLGLEQVSTDDDFFAVGGHSLLATRIVSQLHKVLRIEVPFTVLFEAPTIAATAKRLEALVKGKQGIESTPIVPVTRAQRLPLSYAQQRLWFLDQLQPNSNSYNNPSALRLTGTLDRKALERTLSEIIRRHEILRTTFRVVDGEPVQMISSPAPVSLAVLDVSQRPGELWQVVRKEASRPFDLANGPLLRLVLLSIKPDEHVLVITMHHIVTDAWSNGIFMREAAVLYQAFSDDQQSPLSELTVQYADYSFWQRHSLTGETLERHLAYWRQQLSGPLPMLEIGDHTRSEVRTARGAKQTVSFASDLLEDLKTLSRRRGVTLFMTLLASFKIVLHLFTKQDDIVIGTDVAGRNRAEVESLIGFFVNQLVLRTDLSGDPTFGELLERVREVALGAYAHQDLPFDRLVEALKPQRDLKYAPFFQIKLVLENTSPSELKLPGVNIESLETETESAKLDLILVLRERSDGLQGWFEYDCELIDDATVTRLAEYMEVILRSALASPDNRISELERECRSLEQQQYEDAWRESFKKIKPQPVILTAD